MNRCRTASPFFSIFLLLFAILMSVSIQVSAQDSIYLRNFPDRAKRGVMQFGEPPELTLNGKPERLSPGSQIRGTNNMLVISGALIGKQMNVMFIREQSGLIHRVWILTDVEAAAHPLPSTF